MTPLERDMAADDDRRFDLLADGELSEAERRELLSAIEDEPGGWRRCALAFLEGQCWRRELGAVRKETAERPAGAVSVSVDAAFADDPAPSVAAGRRSTWLLHTTGTPLAMAASFLASMALGWWAFGPRRGDDFTPAPPVHVAEHGSAAGAAPGPDVGPWPDRGLAGQEPAVSRQQGAPPETVPGRWRWVTLTPAAENAQGADPIRLPAVEPPAFDENWLQSLPGGLPPEVLEALRDAGHRVRHHRDLVPFMLDDGRRLLVPVDEVDVHYVGNSMYQ